MKNRFYTYVYLDPRKEGHHCYQDMCFLHEPIYVGKGQGKRCLDHLKRLDNKYRKGQNGHFKNKLLKIIQGECKGFDVEKCILVVRDKLTEREAFEFEKYLIQEIGRVDLKTGPLTNLSDGGKGGGSRSKEVCEKISKALKGREALNKGCKLSEAAKEKISKAMKGRNAGSKNQMFGKKRTEEAKRKTSEKLKGEKHPMFGVEKSEETRRKISQSLQGKKHTDEFKLKQKWNQKERRNLEAGLTKKQVCQIHMLLKLNFQIKDISQEYKKHIDTIRNIKTGKSWNDIYSTFYKKKRDRT